MYISVILFTVVCIGVFSRANAPAIGAFTDVSSLSLSPHPLNIIIVADSKHIVINAIKNHLILFFIDNLQFQTVALL